MELTAAAAALEALKRPCTVVLHTDSEYVRNGITRWHTGWVRKNWRNAAGDPVANMDLWRRLLDAAAKHEIEWRWVRGHAGDVMNERAADVLATRRARRGSPTDQLVQRLHERLLPIFLKKGFRRVGCPCNPPLRDSVRLVVGCKGNPPYDFFAPGSRLQLLELDHIPEG